jgi:predicted acyl esterase
LHRHAPASSRRRRTAVLLAAAVALTAAALGTGPAAAQSMFPSTSNVISNTDVTLTMSDGTALTGILTEPGTPGPHPTIVFIASWATPDFEYTAQAQQFAADGYIVLQYEARGFYASGGTIDVAGPQDVADVSTVIDWLIANTPTDPAEIGVGGISYGAGLALLAAAHDPRIKAVASLSTWTDLVYSLFPDGTRHYESTAMLQALAELTGRPSADFQQQLSDFFADQNVAEVEAWGAVRSPQTYVDQINANGTAVLISNNLQDSIFAPNQIAAFYNDLTTPKHLMLQPGDHATAEAAGLLGLPSQIWTNVHSWFDHYLTGAANGINTQEPVQIEQVGGSAYTGYPSLAAVAPASSKLTLGGRNLLGYGSLGSSADSWSTRINMGTDTCADGGTLFITGILTQFLDAPPTCWLPAVDQGNGAIWQSSALGSAEHIRGEPALDVTITPSASSGTLFAYLYDVNWLDDGSLISYVPYSYTGATPGAPLTISVPMQYAAYDVPAGDSLGLVIDTKDPLFLDQDQSGSTLAFSGTGSAPSTVTVPLG